MLETLFSSIFYYSLFHISIRRIYALGIGGGNGWERIHISRALL